MSLETLLAKLAVPPVPPEENGGGTSKPAPDLAVPLVPPVPPFSNDAELKKNKPRLENLQPDQPVACTPDGRLVYRTPAGNLIAPLDETTKAKAKAKALMLSGALDHFERGWPRGAEAVRRVLDLGDNDECER